MKLTRSQRTKRILHTRRPVVPGRPLHATIRVHEDIPSLRHPAIIAAFRELIAAARARGVRTVCFAIMKNHIHWMVVPCSAAALRDATRYVWAQLARTINRMLGRRGAVFTERYYSTCCASVRQAFQTLGYVLRNARAAGYRVPQAGFDCFTDVVAETFAADGFLQRVTGPTWRLCRELLLRMARAPVPFVPLDARLQPGLPGL